LAPRSSSTGSAKLAEIEPIHVAAYIELMQTTVTKPAVKLRLAGIRKTVRLAEYWPSPGRESGARGAPAQARRAARQVTGAHRGTARRLAESLDISTSACAIAR
jgi:hypothetical protein